MVKKILSLVMSLTIPFIAGFLGSYFTTPAITGWYANINKPPFNPPNFIFAPVWTLLYILIGISLYLIIQSKNPDNNKPYAIKIYMIQITLNTLWSILFFGLRNPQLALIEILILLVLIIYNIRLFYSINKTAAYLLVPYFLWGVFATILNTAIVYLN